MCFKNKNLKSNEKDATFFTNTIFMIGTTLLSLKLINNNNFFSLITVGNVKNYV